MNWFGKALVFKSLSAIPGGAALYRYAQWNWTKSIVATPERVSQKLDVGMEYLTWLMDHGHTLEQIRGMRHLDLGTGWHPTIPLLFQKIGLRDQILADVTALTTSDTFVDALAQTERILNNPQHPAQNFFTNEKFPAVSHGANLTKLLNDFSMSYHAPYFEWAGSAGEVVDLVTCTQVLMHVERPILDDCFKLIYGVLKPGGIFMAPVHLFDIYSNSDPKISIYNHLRYSRKFWKKVISSDIMTFNRHKSPDYRQALEGAGFEILTFDIEGGSPADLKKLALLDVHSEFSSRYSRDELSEKHLFFVARKP